MADLAQTIKDAEIDARSLSEFIYKPASFMVSRRLAPPVHTLDYYIKYLSGIKSELEGLIIENGVSSNLVSVNNGNTQRTLSNKLDELISVFDFGAVGDGSTNDTQALTLAGESLPIVDLLGKTYRSDSIPQGLFVNGVIKTPQGESNYSLIPPKKLGLRVATWNVWGGGSAATNFDGDRFSPARLAELKANFLKLGFDIVGLQETYHNKAVLPANQYTVHPLTSAVAGIAMEFKGGDKYGNITLASKEPTSTSSKIYNSQPTGSDSELRSYVKSVYNYNGKTVSVYNTHFSYAESRVAEMANELCTAVLSDTSNVVFVMGDFNTNQWSLFSQLTNAGFLQVNNNTLDTNPSPSNSWFIDEIFYKGTTMLGSPAVYIDQKLADHSALYADFAV